MSDYGGFPMSVVVTSFFVTSLAYLICCCCCIIQFFLRRNRALVQNRGQNIFGHNVYTQKNDTLKRKLVKNFADSLKRFKKSRTPLPESFVKQEGLPESCPICFEEYSENVEEIVIGFIKPCNHFYHFDCIWKWLENRGNCPLCRENVTLKEEDIKGIALRNLPKYLKDKGITVSKEDHVVINIKSDSDSDIPANCGTDEANRDPQERVSSLPQASGHVAVVEVTSAQNQTSTENSASNSLDRSKVTQSDKHEHTSELSKVVSKSADDSNSADGSTHHSDNRVEQHCNDKNATAEVDVRRNKGQGADNPAYETS